MISTIRCCGRISTNSALKSFYSKKASSLFFPSTSLRLYSGSYYACSSYSKTQFPVMNTKTTPAETFCFLFFFLFFISSSAKVHFTKQHEWISIENGVGTVGISDYAQDGLGEVVYVDLPVVGNVYEAESSLAQVESVKAVSDVYSPVAGEVVAVNESLLETPALINNSPEEKGWIVKLKVRNSKDVESLFSKDQYKKYLETAKSH
eukprot:Sdes_comp19048_c0_seq3m9631